MLRNPIDEQTLVAVAHRLLDAFSTTHEEQWIDRVREHLHQFSNHMVY